MADTFKELEAAVLALSSQEQAALLQTLLNVLQPGSGIHQKQPAIAEAPPSYMAKGAVPMEKKVQYLVERLNHLSPAKQVEVGDFIEFLHQRETGKLLRIDNAAKLPLRQENGLWTFDLPADTPRVTAQQVQKLLDES